MRFTFVLVFLISVLFADAQDKGGVVLGKIVDAQNNKVEGASVLFKQKGEKNQSFISNSDGVFLI
jgi:hypothetical protein